MQIYLHICSADNLYRQIRKKAPSVVLYRHLAVLVAAKVQLDLDLVAKGILVPEYLTQLSK